MLITAAPIHPQSEMALLIVFIILSTSAVWFFLAALRWSGEMERPTWYGSTMIVLGYGILIFALTQIPGSHLALPFTYDWWWVVIGALVYLASWSLARLVVDHEIERCNELAHEHSATEIDQSHRR
jgi:phosphatidylglycerophosphate synthase